MSLTKSATEPGGRLASYVDRIVEDEKPAGLPCGLSRSTARRRRASRTPPRHVAGSAGPVLPTTLACPGAVLVGGHWERDRAGRQHALSGNDISTLPSQFAGQLKRWKAERGLGFIERRRPSRGLRPHQV